MENRARRATSYVDRRRGANTRTAQTTTPGKTCRALFFTKDRVLQSRAESNANIILRVSLRSRAECRARAIRDRVAGNCHRPVHPRGLPCPLPPPPLRVRDRHRTHPPSRVSRSDPCGWWRRAYPSRGGSQIDKGESDGERANKEGSPHMSRAAHPFRRTQTGAYSPPPRGDREIRLARSLAVVLTTRGFKGALPSRFTLSLSSPSLFPAVTVIVRVARDKRSTLSRRSDLIFAIFAILRLVKHTPESENFRLLNISPVQQARDFFHQRSSS